LFFVPPDVFFAKALQSRHPLHRSANREGQSMGKLTLAALAACAAIQIASVEAAVVVASKSIQAAVTEAKPGDTIFVPPGTYWEMVQVLKDNLTILGSEGAIIDASGFPNGIHVGAEIFPQVPGGTPVCPAIAVKNFTLIGLTIQNAVANGIFPSGVDTYTLAHGKYLHNGDYAIYPCRPPIETSPASPIEMSRSSVCLRLVEVAWDDGDHDEPQRVEASAGADRCR
jgi:hypothetical protein